MPEEELSMLITQEATQLTLLECISGHVDLCRISRLNTSPKELVLTCSMHESWEGWNKMLPGAQKEREGVGPLGDAGGTWNSRTSWPAKHNKNTNQLQVAGSFRDWQKASPSLKLVNFLGLAAEVSGGRSSKQKTIAVSAVGLQDSIIHSHQLDLSLPDPFESRTRNTKNIYKPANKEVVREVVDAGLRKKSPLHTHKEDADKGVHALDPSPPQLTLAQKLGLVEPPSLPLTAEKWVEVKQSIQHRDSIQPCAICREELALQPQARLKAFEKFTGKKSCPLLCRKEQYQTRAIHDGARLFEIKCAVR
ncbi:LOW QUALITY PROTEIN: RING finger protein 32 [Amazona ochrocephala]